MPALLDLRRSAAAFVAVAMSAALIVFVFIVSDSVRTRVTESARASVGNADVVVLADRKDDAAGGRISERAVQQVSAADGVASVRPYVEGRGPGRPPGRGSGEQPPGPGRTGAHGQHPPGGGPPAAGG